MDISVGMTAAQAVVVADTIKAAAQEALQHAGAPAAFEQRIYCTSNETGEEVIITISNDDMEGRAGYRDMMLVDVGR